MLNNYYRQMFQNCSFKYLKKLDISLIRCKVNIYPNQLFHCMYFQLNFYSIEYVSHKFKCVTVLRGTHSLWLTMKETSLSYGVCTFHGCYMYLLNFILYRKGNYNAQR